MKKWENPEMEALDLENTLHGTYITANYDEIRVDQDGQYWRGGQSGIDSKPSCDGTIIVPK